VHRLCELFGIAPSTYYYHRNKPSKPDRFIQARPHIRHIFDNSYRAYGYRRVRAVLANKHGLCLSGKTVLRLMREESRFCQVRRKKYRSYKGEVGKTAPNVLQREFKAEAPNQKWVTDVTEFKIGGLKQYLSPVIDLFNSEVVAYTLMPTPALPLVNDMLDKAIATLPQAAKPIIHSDQGWHYQHRSYRATLEAHGLQQSMSRKGNCLDNAMAENFFGHFKEEFLRRRKFDSVSHFKAELARYIAWYNNERIQLKLKGLSPVEYRTQSLANLNPTPI